MSTNYLHRFLLALSAALTPVRLRRVFFEGMRRQDAPDELFYSDLGLLRPVFVGGSNLESLLEIVNRPLSDFRALISSGRQ